MKRLRASLRRLRAFAVVFSAATMSSAVTLDRAVLIEMGKRPEPPTMNKRTIVEPATRPAGREVELVDGDCKATLFVPAKFVLPTDGRIDLIIHFHGAPHFIIDEHVRHGLHGPLLVVNIGQGSSVYGRAFDDPLRLNRFETLVEKELGADARVTNVELSSFSAGYGAVREILKDDGNIAAIRRIVLCDSLYAGWDPATTQPGATSRPSPDNMRPFETFARLAAAGDKTFVLAHSSVPTPYANTAATGEWLIDLVDAPRTDIPRDTTLASSDADFPLRYRADVGHFHVWGYGGEHAQAHMTHVRHLADLWQALDDASEP